MIWSVREGQKSPAKCRSRALDDHTAHGHSCIGCYLGADSAFLQGILSRRELELDHQLVIGDELALVAPEALALGLEGGLGSAVCVGWTRVDLVIATVIIGWTGGASLIRGVPVKAWVALAVSEIAAQVSCE